MQNIQKDFHFICKYKMPDDGYYLLDIQLDIPQEDVKLLSILGTEVQAILTTKIQPPTSRYDKTRYLLYILPKISKSDYMAWTKIIDLLDYYSQFYPFIVQIIKWITEKLV